MIRDTIRAETDYSNINSTGQTHPNYESPEQTKKTIEEFKIASTDFIVDQDGSLGKLFGAKTTPHMFIIDKGKLVYQCAIDDNSDSDVDPKESRNYVRAGLEELSGEKTLSTKETTPYGCSVKYDN